MWATGILSVILIIAAIGLWQLRTDRTELRNKVSTLELTLSSSTQMLSEAKVENTDLLNKLDEEQAKVSALQREVRKITRTVNEIEKLRSIEPELLQKYSKVFFLNEHYSPAKLSELDPDFHLIKEKTIQMDSRILPFLEDMLEDAKDDDITLSVASGYRAFGTQAVLKTNYTVTYGQGANQFSADQGYSEHQLGSAVDLAIPTNPSLTIGFEQTDAFKWLSENAHRYGFTLSYPKNNQFYQYEPWHWRFVGRDLARKLHLEKKSFYDLDQREINTYLIDLFE
jgi:zinc D-Ala-D-Ala carboxypeptidase